MVFYLPGFTFSGNANCVTGLYHARSIRDRSFAFNCCKNDQNNTVNSPERTSVGVVKTHSAPSTIRFKSYYGFQSKVPASVLTCTSLFSRQSAMKKFVPMHIRCTMFKCLA